MANAIKQRTRELHEERMNRRRDNRDTLRPDFPRMKNRLATEGSSLSSVPGLDSNVRNARLHGHNTGVGKGIWSLSSRVPAKPYQPVLTDAYPRDPYTMMPQQPSAPKYFEGKFWSYDYKDSVQQAKQGDYNEGRHVIFKTQDIEKVQTRKKYGQNLKGESSVPLHLCNDITSELFQRSLRGPYEHGQRDRSHLMPESRASEISELQSIADRYPDVRLRKAKNDTSALNPLGTSRITQRWIDTAYPTSSHGRYHNQETFGAMESARSQRKRYSVKSEPEWYSSSFPKQKVADAMKFMGQKEDVTHKTPRKEYDINFHGFMRLGWRHNGWQTNGLQ